MKETYLTRFSRYSYTLKEIEEMADLDSSVDSGCSAVCKLNDIPMLVYGDYHMAFAVAERLCTDIDDFISDFVSMIEDSKNAQFADFLLDDAEDSLCVVLWENKNVMMYVEVGADYIYIKTVVDSRTAMINGKVCYYVSADAIPVKLTSDGDCVRGKWDKSLKEVTNIPEFHRSSGQKFARRAEHSFEYWEKQMERSPR